MASAPQLHLSTDVEKEINEDVMRLCARKRHEHEETGDRWNKFVAGLVVGRQSVWAATLHEFCVSF